MAWQRTDEVGMFRRRSILLVARSELMQAWGQVGENEEARTNLFNFA